MRSFSYSRAASPEDVVAMLAQGGPQARLVAGGTTLYDLMKLDVESPGHLIDVTGIADLSQITVGEAELTFGALALMSDVAADPRLAEAYPVLTESLQKAASQQLRNMATVGGNLLQRTRCNYFRNDPLYPCNKRAPGSGCAALEGLDRGHAIFGGSPSCVAVYPGDWAVALVALDASVDTLSPRGPRTLPVADLHRLPGDTPERETALEPDEMILRIRVPANPSGRASTYHKIRDRESYAFALVSAAAALWIEEGAVTAAHLALGGVATRPWRVPRAERLLVGRRMTSELALEAGRAAFEDARPGRQNAFKIDLGAQVVADALMIATERSTRP